MDMGLLSLGASMVSAIQYLGDIISIFYYYSFVLFVHGSIFSYVFIYFANGFDAAYEFFAVLICVLLNEILEGYVSKVTR